ncbi:calponin-like domain protein, partial [Thalictrum thalictroides]
AEIVFNESTETETGSSETEIIEPVVVETRVPDHGGGNAQPSAIGRHDGVANPSNEVTDQHKTVSTWAKKISSWADEVESESSHVDRSGSVSNNTLTVVDEAINTSSKSERVDHVCRDLKGVSTSTLRSNIPRQQPIVRQRKNDDKIGEHIGFALLQLDELNRKKDVARMEVETIKITCKEYRDKYEAAKSAQNIAYDVLNAKRQELYSVQSTLNMIENALLLEQTADKVRNMQHRLEHETIYSIQEEKRLMHELKRLEANHRELLSIVERQAKPQPSFDEKEPLEKRLKALKEELDSAKKELSQIKPITNAARKVYFDMNGKLNEMQGQFRAANVFCQEAYANVQNLKRLLFKNKYFQMYKDDDFRNKYLISNPMSTIALAVARRKIEDDKVVTLSTSIEKPEMIKEENKHSQEEEELPREEKVLHKENVAVKSREEIIAEEKAKAKEAEDRKKRNAEKAKEAEDRKKRNAEKAKEKEKAKRDRKKARKKAQKCINVEGESLVPSSEDPSLELITQEQEPKISEKPTVAQELPRIKEKPRSKNSNRPSVLAKTKVVVSPPIPNKNKTKPLLWKWVILSTPLVVAASLVCLPVLL